MLVEQRIYNYPILHFTVSIIAGILAAERFSDDYAVTKFGYVAAAIMFVCCCATFPISRYRLRRLFAVSACLAFAALGAALYGITSHRTFYNWEKGGAVYLATVTGKANEGEKTLRTEVCVDAVLDTATGGWCKVGRKALVYLMTDSTQATPLYGDRICMKAAIRRPYSEAALTGFDYGKYLFRKGISGTGISYKGEWRKLGGEPAYSMKLKALMLRDKVVDKLKGWGLEGDVLATVAALTVGDRSGLEDGLRGVYNAAGASHILALSGMHVGILIALVMTLLYPLSSSYWGRKCLSVAVTPLLWGFAFMVGLSPSVVRAVTMFTVIAVARWATDNSSFTLNALTLAAMMMLIVNPMSVYDVGFQLSFVAAASISESTVFSVASLTKKAHRGSRFHRAYNTAFRWVTSLFLMSVAAQVSTMPLVLHYFGTLPTYSLLSTFIITPLATILLWSAVTAFAFSWLPFVCSTAVSLMSYSALLMNRLMSSVSGFSGAQFVSVYISWTQAVVLAALIVLAYRYLRRRSMLRLFALLMTACILTFSGIYGRLASEDERAFIHRGALYGKAGRTVRLITDECGIYSISGKNVCLASDGKWRGMKSPSALTLDCLCLSRGFRGSIDELQNLFVIKYALLDSSLPSWQSSALREECEKAGIPYRDLAESGPYMLPL